MVKLLIETGKVDVDSKDNHNQTPLSWAAKRGHEAVVKLLVETGKADVDSKDNCNQTPLSWAAKRGHEAVVKLLVKTGRADVDSKDNRNQMPLSWAGFLTIRRMAIHKPYCHTIWLLEVWQYGLRIAIC